MTLITQESYNKILNDVVKPLQDFTEISCGVFGLKGRNIYPSGFDYDKMKAAFSIVRRGNESLKLRREEFLEIIYVIGQVIKDFLFYGDVVHITGIGRIFFRGVDMFESKGTLKVCRKNNIKNLATLTGTLVPAIKGRYSILQTKQTNMLLIEFHRLGGSFPKYYI